MENSNKFLDIFYSLKKKERKSFVSWLEMEVPKGLEKERMKRLIDELSVSLVRLNIHEINWTNVFNKKEIEHNHIKYLTSDLNQHLENMLAYQMLKEDTILKKRLLVKNYRNRNISKRRLETIEIWEADMEKRSYRDIEYFEQKARIYMYKKENLLITKQSLDRQAYDEQIYEYWELRIVFEFLYRVCCITEANRAGKKPISSVFLLDSDKLISKLLSSENIEKFPTLHLLTSIANLCTREMNDISEDEIRTVKSLFETNAHLCSPDISQNLFRILLKMIARVSNFKQKDDFLWEFVTIGIEQEWLMLTLDAYKYFVRLSERKKHNPLNIPVVEAFCKKHEDKWLAHQAYTEDILRLFHLENLFSDRKYQELVQEGLRHSFNFLSEDINAKMLVLMSWYLYEYKGEGIPTLSLSPQRITETEDKIEKLVDELEKKIIRQFKKENFTEQANQKKKIYLDLLNVFRFLFKQMPFSVKKQKRIPKQKNLTSVVELEATNIFFTTDWAKMLFDEYKEFNG